MKKLLGEKIKKIRVKCGLSQQKFAESLGYTHKSMINKIETGQSDMSYEKLLILIKEYNLDVKEFFDENDDLTKIDKEIKKISKPNPNKVYPLKSNNQRVIYVKPTINNINIIVGDFTYFDGENFENHVTHHYDFIGDKLIIGKFCQIGRGVEFVMNGANHQMNAASTYPFYIFNGWEQNPPASSDMPFKGDTVIGNDVWIGQNVTILPGIHIGDGCIIGANAVVANNIPPYSVAVGNPARVIKKRFNDELIELLLKLKWWDNPIEQINKIIPIIANSDLNFVKNEIIKMLEINDNV